MTTSPKRAKKLGILTSGGDCPGLNAVFRATIKCALRRGWEVYGIPHGTDGLIDLHRGRFQPEELKLTERGYDIPGPLQGLDVLQFLSGSILGALSHGNPDCPETAAEILSGYQKLGLDALIFVGGDGSLDIIDGLAQKGGWNVIGIPKTIDNDVPFTDRAIGFDTAVNTVTNALYNLTFTAASHDRVMVVEVMGRDAGHLALQAGIAGGADAILIPELVPRLDEPVIHEICRRLAQLRSEGRKFALIAISEGVPNAEGQKCKHIGTQLAQLIQERSHMLCATGSEDFCDLDRVETRATTLGHIQRSGTPTAFDRVLASAFAKQAVDLIAAEQYGRLVVWSGGKVGSVPFEAILPTIRRCHAEGHCTDPVRPNDDLVCVARAMGIHLGEVPPLPLTASPAAIAQPIGVTSL